MNSRFCLGLVLASLLLAILALSAPARLLGFIIPSDAFVLQGFRGSIWEGSAARCLIAIGHGYVHLGSVEWRLAPLSLLTLSPAVDLNSRWGDQSMSGQITLRTTENFEIRDLQASVSAQLLRQFTPFMIEGTIDLQLARLVIRDGLPYSGRGRVILRDAAWLSPQGPRALGSYALDFEQPEDQALTGEIVTIEGPVNASGNIALEARHYALDVVLSSAAGLDAHLQEAVSLFAQPEADGYRIALNGDL